MAVSATLLKNTSYGNGSVAYRASSWWFNVEMDPPNAIFRVTAAYKQDTNPKKVSPGVGAYCDDSGKRNVLPSLPRWRNDWVQRKWIKSMPLLLKAHSSVICPSVSPRRREWVIKKWSAWYITRNYRYGISEDCCSFHGKTFFRKRRSLFTHTITENSHHNLQTLRPQCAVDIQGAVQDIPNIPEKSVILFHAYAHNSTGVDPKTEQWIEISEVFRQKELFPFFDIAY